MRNKRKGILMACSILGSAAIVSTGFAAWVVSTNVTETATGNIEVDEVLDKRVTMTTPTFVNDDGLVSFGIKQTQSTISGAWLTNNTTSLYEDLDVSFKFTPDWKETNITEDIPLTFSIAVSGSPALTYSSDDTANYATAKNLTLITLPDLSSYNKSYKQGEEVTVNLNFGWGTAFGEENPYTYFNTTKTAGGKFMTGDTIKDHEVDEAIDRLNALHSLVGNGASIQFTVTISYTAN